MITENTMRFGSMMWHINPEEIKITRDRKLSLKSDGTRSVLFDRGEDGATVKVSGCFFGENADAMAAELENLMIRGSTEALYLPGMGLIRAKLKKLERQGTGGFGKAAYGMEFIEIKLPAGQKIPELISGKTYVASGGESIWDVADAYKLSAEELVRLNPHIRHINLLREGEVLWLR